ncbi:uncharacterized protein RHOBADRAFT_55116, partial [Rhodotorula graminis WP1]
ERRPSLDAAAQDGRAAHKRPPAQAHLVQDHPPPLAADPSSWHRRVVHLVPHHPRVAEQLARHVAAVQASCGDPAARVGTGRGERKVRERILDEAAGPRPRRHGARRARRCEAAIGVDGELAAARRRCGWRRAGNVRAQQRRAGRSQGRARRARARQVLPCAATATCPRRSSRRTSAAAQGPCREAGEAARAARPRGHVGDRPGHGEALPPRRLDGRARDQGAATPVPARPPVARPQPHARPPDRQALAVRHLFRRPVLALLRRGHARQVWLPVHHVGRLLGVDRPPAVGAVGPDRQPRARVGRRARRVRAPARAHVPLGAQPRLWRPRTAHVLQRGQVGGVASRLWRRPRPAPPRARAGPRRPRPPRQDAVRPRRRRPPALPVPHPVARRQPVAVRLCPPGALLVLPVLAALDRPRRAHRVVALALHRRALAHRDARRRDARAVRRRPRRRARGPRARPPRARDRLPRDRLPARGGAQHGRRRARARDGPQRHHDQDAHAGAPCRHAALCRQDGREPAPRHDVPRRAGARRAPRRAAKDGWLGRAPGPRRRHRRHRRQDCPHAGRGLLRRVASVRVAARVRQGEQLHDPDHERAARPARGPGRDRLEAAGRRRAFRAAGREDGAQGRKREEAQLDDPRRLR